MLKFSSVNFRYWNLAVTDLFKDVKESIEARVSSMFSTLPAKPRMFFGHIFLRLARQNLYICADSCSKEE